MNDKNRKYLFWNIIQKLAMVIFFVCVAYLCISVALHLTTRSVGKIESMWGPARFMPHTVLILGGAVLSLAMIFISTKMKNKK